MSIASKLALGACALKSIAVGLRITGRTMTMAPETVIYPMAQVDNLGDYRGHIELVGREGDQAKPRCIGCGLCMTTCPSSCIDVECAQDPGQLFADKPFPAQEHFGQLVPKAEFGRLPQYFTPGRWILEYSTCSLCGQCVRACPAVAIRFSNHVYYATTSREGVRLDLLARLADQARQAEEAQLAAWDKPAVAADDSPDALPDAKSEARPDAKPDERSDAAPKIKLNERFDAKPDAKPDERADAAPDAKPEPSGQGPQASAAGQGLFRRALNALAGGVAAATARATRRQDASQPARKEAP